MKAGDSEIPPTNSTGMQSIRLDADWKKQVPFVSENIWFLALHVLIETTEKPKAPAVTVGLHRTLSYLQDLQKGRSKR